MSGKNGFARQQGDVRMIPMDAPPVAKERELVESGIIAYGEATGHTHRVVGNAKVYRIDGELWIDARGEVTVVHEEHKPVPLKRQWYKVRIVREYDHFAEEARNVMD